MALNFNYDVNDDIDEENNKQEATLSQEGNRHPDLQLSKDGKTLIKYNGEKANLYLPPTVKIIGVGAFKGNPYIRIVHLEGVEIIEREAFMECPNITEALVVKNIKEIGDCAFYNSSLLYFNFPNSYVVVGEKAFAGTKIKQIHIPLEVKTIRKYAFANSKLCGITVEGSESDHNFEGEWDAAFENGTGAHYLVRYDAKQSDDMYTIRGIVFVKCEATIRGKFVVDPKCKEIGAGAFKNQKGLSMIYLPEKYDAIGNEAFKGCTSLKTVHFEKYPGLSRIGDSAFEDTDLEGQIELPPTVSYIGERAFSNIANAKSFRLSSLPKFIGPEAFSGSKGFVYINHKKPLFGRPLSWDKNWAKGFLGEIVWEG